jgi:hypothetical protein
MWYTYTTPFDNTVKVLCKIDDNTVISGIAEHMPEYLAWIEEGNEAEEWQPESEQQ